MAINSCSINSFTINSLKCRRKVFDINPPLEINGGQVQQVRYKNWEDEEIRLDNVELSTFRVDVVINNKIVGYSLVDNNMDNMIISTDIKNINSSKIDIDITSISVKKHDK